MKCHSNFDELLYPVNYQTNIEVLRLSAIKLLAKLNKRVELYRWEPQ